MKLRSGKKISEDQFKWINNFPSTSEEKIGIEVTDNGASNEGMWNANPTYEVQGVLCEF